MSRGLTVLSWITIALGLLTALVIGVDVSRHRQRMPIMDIVWPVTGLYMPVFGIWLYRRLGRPMSCDSVPSSRERAFSASIVLSSTHCGSGCVLGDMIAAPIVFAAGWTLAGQRLFADYIGEFIAAYIFGIAFQYFPIRAMRQLPPGRALIDAIKADTLSLTAFELGMFGWMAIAVYLILPQQPPEPRSAVFWFMMQIGMLLGFLTTYPANWLLVRSGVKGGM